MREDGANFLGTLFDSLSDRTGLKRDRTGLKRDRLDSSTIAWTQARSPGLLKSITLPMHNQNSSCNLLTFNTVSTRAIAEANIPHHEIPN